MNPQATAAGSDLNDLPLVTELPVEHLVDLSVDLEPAQLIPTPFGLRYTLVVKREWRDGHGLPLKEEFRHEFRASPPIERALTMTAWRVTPPKSGTREPVAVTFPNPLDHGLLRRALGVAKGGAAVVGDVSIESDETRWLFTPRDAWAPGDYELVVAMERTSARIWLEPMYDPKAERVKG